MSTMYPKAKFRYKVEIDGMEAGGFSEVTGGDITVEPIEYREGDMSAETPIKVVGLKKYGNITLKQGMTDSRVLYEWLEPAINGDAERKTVTITLLDETQAPIASWQAINAWPTKYTVPDLNATASEIAIETLEIVHEGLTRVS